MDMKTALLTGSTGGLGREVSKILAKNGWNLILVNRDKEQADQQISSLTELFPNQTFDGYTANLMDIDDVQKIAKNIAAAHPRILALYNIAGLLTDKRILSPQNIEGHFALNALAPYMLIRALKPQLKAAGKPDNPAFIVSFSTSAVNNVKTLDTSKLVKPDTIGGLMDAYAKSKAVLNVMACFLKDELLADNIYIYSLDPGATKTQMTNSNQGMPWFVRLLVPLLFGDAAKQAQKLVHAVDDAVKSKQTAVFISNGKIKPNPPLANDADIQTRARTLMDSLIENGSPLEEIV
jgi:NAD(P)-dependent dehydrogenase (short-subunit alcohol dehydrogenase family)